MIIFSPLGLPAEMEAKSEVGTFMLHQKWHREILILLGPWKQEQHNGQHQTPCGSGAAGPNYSEQAGYHVPGKPQGEFGKQTVITCLGSGSEAPAHTQLLTKVTAGVVARTSQMCPQ